LRREHQKCASESNLEADGDKSPQASTPQSSFEPTFNVDMDLNQIQKDASQSIINAVRKYETKSSDSSSTLNIAICMSTVAEGLLKFHQTKESIVFLQEALEIYRKYGGINRNLARALNALGRAYLKLSDTTSAISMIEESEQIFKNCDCSNHYDSISNSLLRASIYMEHGQFDQAQKKYEDSIASKKCVYGTYAVTTAKLINEYAATLAKNNRMDESLQQYKFAREIYQYLLQSDNNERFLVFKDHADKFALDTTLTDLNMASIMSKIGNHRGALDAYDKGIRGLRSHISQAKAYNLDAAELFRLTAQKRHLVSALGRVGSLKLKIGDEPGALASYLQLLKEVDENSPKISRMEKAKAAVKCATIYRQMGKKENNACAVAHLNDALKMYLELYGPNHKDTKAIAASLKQWQRIDAATQ
jgi:tetratricopeptide (TPR) repeat protein